MKTKTNGKRTKELMEDHLLTVEQLSEFLQVSVSTIYKWTHFGYVPHFQLTGGCIRFDKKQILRWLKKKQKKGRSSYLVHVNM